MTDASVAETPAGNEILIRGSEYIKHFPDFKLVGRDQESIELQTILMRKHANGVILTGSSGVGMSALALGLQSGKKDLSTPLDILNTRFFWLDTDKLFESGDPKEINQSFQKMRATLAESKETVPVIENSANFLESARNLGCSNLINGLLGDVKRGRYQAILESPYEDLIKVLKCDSDMRSEFTLMDLKEPKPAELREILKATVPGLESYHGIKVSQEALETAAMLTEKYKLKELQALPSGTVTLLDRSLATYRYYAHSRPIRLDGLEEQLKAVNEALVTGKKMHDLADKSPRELQALKASLETDIKSTHDEWEKLQTELRVAYEKKRASEKLVAGIADKIEKTNADDNKAIRSGGLKKAANTAAGAPADGNEDVFAQFENIESEEVTKLREKIAAHQQVAQTSAASFKGKADKINHDLVLTPDHVLKTFSKISGIPVSKLTQDDREKLLKLEENLGQRVFGQDHAITALADAIRVAKTGLQDANKPEAVFLFMGPSGVGKTELIKGLAAELFDDESAMIRLDMSEYMEKHSVARLIGAPPGYAGFEEGGELTNKMEQNPNRIIMLDEVEKAHPDVFNLFLQILDDARVTSGKGVTSSFKNTIIIMTTNIGAEYFLDKSLSMEQARTLAIADLLKFFRNEFLNRFNGKENIVGFKRLEMDSMIRIAKREIKKLNDWVREKGLSVTLSDEDHKKICEDRYDPMNGARGIPGYFSKAVRSKVAKFTLENPDAKGALHMHYEPKTQSVAMEALDEAKIPANDLKGTMNNAAKPATTERTPSHG